MMTTRKNKVKGKGEDAFHRERSTRKLKESIRGELLGWTTCIKCKVYAALIRTASGSVKCKNCGFEHTGKVIPNGAKQSNFDLTLTLTNEQYDILKKVMVIQDYKSLEEYVNNAVMSILKADADHCLAGVPREKALKVLEDEQA